MLRILERPPWPRRAGPSLALLVAVTMTGTVAMHLFVPALPTIAADLDTSAFAVQLTITVYLCGLAAGQLLYGAISDRFGRRPVLIVSLGLYVAGLLLAIPSPNIAWLVATRILQSLGACGSLVLGRAMVRDVSTSQDAARKLSILVTALTLTPALAPGLGGFLNAWIGWRAMFGVLAAIVGGLGLLVLLTLPETSATVRAPSGMKQILRGYSRLLGIARFRNYLLAGACGTSIYAFLAIAPFLLVDVLGRTSQEVGLDCLIVTIGIAVGAVTASSLARRLNTRQGGRLGNLVCLVSAAALVLVDVTGTLSLPTLLAPLIAFAIGLGMVSPNAVAGLMNVDPRAAGTASSLYGFSQMALGVLFTLSVSVWHSGSALPMAVTLTGAALIAAAALQRV